MLAKGLNVAEWEGVMQRHNSGTDSLIDPSKPSSSNFPPGYYTGVDNPICGTTESHFLPQGSTPDVEKRRSITSIVGGVIGGSSGIGGGGALSNMTTSTKSSHNSNSEQSGSPGMLSRHDRSRRSTSGGSNNNNNGGDSVSKQTGLSFTQQVQQLSRMKGRPGSRLLSPLNEPQSPIYASPPQSPSSDSINDDRVSPHSAFPGGSHHNSGDFSGADIGLGGKSGSPHMTNGCGVQPFAFTRVSQYNSKQQFVSK